MFKSPLQNVQISVTKCSNLKKFWKGRLLWIYIWYIWLWGREIICNFGGYIMF